MSRELYYCCDLGSMPKVKELLAGPPGSVNIEHTECNGRTSLIAASESGQEEMLKYLLQMGANVHAKNAYGWTALHCSARNGHKSIIMILLKAGIKADAKDDSQRTALDVARMHGHDEIVAILTNPKKALKAAEKAANKDAPPEKTEEEILDELYYSDPVEWAKRKGL